MRGRLRSPLASWESHIRSSCGANRWRWDTIPIIVRVVLDQGCKGEEEAVGTEAMVEVEMVVAVMRILEVVEWQEGEA